MGTSLSFRILVRLVLINIEGLNNSLTVFRAMEWHIIGQMV
jgi:hypothetical protein